MTTRASNRKSNSPPDDNPYLDGGRLTALQIMLCARLDEVIDELGISLFKSKRMFFGACPVHGGDNAGALNLYRHGDSIPGYWECQTRGCQREFKPTVIGFVRGVLSHQKHDWTSMRDKGKQAQQRKVSWREAVDWCCNFLGTDIRDVEVDRDEIEKRQFAAQVSNMTRVPGREKSGLTRETVRRFLQIPASYFVGRGWSADVLDRYDVGYYPASGKPLSGRVAVPVYDRSHKFVVGFTGRSVYPKCGACGRWHNPDEACPREADKVAWGRSSKWFNHDFRKEGHLYNYWFAEKPIREGGVAVLVEGPGEVWRLEEAGVKVGLAMFGVKLSDEQQILLEMSGAMNLVVLTNMDEAGQQARDDLGKRLCRSFRLHFPTLPANDLGEMPVRQVRDTVLPLVEQLTRRGF